MGHAYIEKQDDKIVYRVTSLKPIHEKHHSQATRELPAYVGACVHVHPDAHARAEFL